jgi:hypothetical protein
MEWLSELPIYLQVFFASAVGTAFVGFIFKLGEMIAQNRIERSNESYRDRKALAEQVIAICVEGNSTSFTRHPRSVEHLYYIAEKVMGEDKKTGELMNKFISTWQVCAGRHQGKTHLTSEEVEFVTTLQKEGREASEAILKVVHKWK